MIKFAVDFPSPIAIRYPRGEAYEGLKDFRAPVVYGESEMIYEESEIALIALGSMVKTGEEVRLKLKEMGYKVTLVNARFAKPLDEKLLLTLAKKHKLIVTMEENVINGGFGEHVTEFYSENVKKKVSLVHIAIKDDYVEHGNVEILRREVGIDRDSVVEKILNKYDMIKSKGKS